METNLIFICAVFVLAGMVKGVTGMGLPTVAMALLGLVMPPLQAAAILVVPSLLTNMWQMLERRGLHALWLRLRPMLLGVCAGTLLGGAFFAKGDGRAVLGIALVLYALLGLTSWRWQVRAAQEPWLGPLVGVATGVLTAVTGVFVLPAVPYLQALGMEKEELVQAMGLSLRYRRWRWPRCWPGMAPGNRRVPACRSWPSCRRWPAWRWAAGCARGSSRRCSGAASSPRCCCSEGT